MLSLLFAVLVAAAGQINGSAQQSPASQINIDSVFAYGTISRDPTMPSYTQVAVECVFFTNTAAQSATHVRFAIVYSNGGTEVGKDHLDSTGTFSTGVAQKALPNDNTPSHSAQCMPFPGRINRGKLSYKRQDVTLSAYVTKVDYADGTSWSK